MKRLIKYPLMAVAAMTLTLGTTSCNKEDSPVTDENSLIAGGAGTISATTYKGVIEQYISQTIIPTYHVLAQRAMTLDEAVNQLSKERTKENLAAACLAWRDARQYWELSEAFLYGAAADYSIDPHIDSWPLNKTALDNLLTNNYLLDNFDAANLGNNLLGFHGLEYVLFSEGKPKEIGTVKENEYKYAVGVANDLALQCIRLEASWAGVENISAEKASMLEEAELTPTRNYGEELIASGSQGNKLYQTSTSGIATILQGCFDIADEVGNSKIYTPWYKKDVLEVESWYSFNSLKDYTDNIISIANSYLGGMEEIVEFDYTAQGEGKTVAYKGNRNEEISISACLKKLDPSLDTRMRAAIEQAIAKINEIPAPYRNNLDKDTQIQAAMNACTNLSEILLEVKQRIEKN